MSFNRFIVPLWLFVQSYRNSYREVHVENRSPDHVHVKKVLAFPSIDQNESQQVSFSSSAHATTNVKEALLRLLKPQFEFTNRIQDKASPISKWFATIFGGRGASGVTDTATAGWVTTCRCLRSVDLYSYEYCWLHVLTVSKDNTLLESYFINNCQIST
jgi:hypothetical protein